TAGTHAGQRQLTAVNKPAGNLFLYTHVGTQAPAKETSMNKDVKERRKAPLTTPTDLGDNARRDITGALNALLADVFALYLKTKNFHWHVSGPHFRDYHLLFDE